MGRGWARACVRLLISDVWNGLLAHVRSGGAAALRSCPHHRADHIVGHHAEAYSHTVRAACRSAGPEFKDQFPISLSLRPKQLRAAAEESAFLITIVAHKQLQY